MEGRSLKLRLISEVRVEGFIDIVLKTQSPFQCVYWVETGENYDHDKEFELVIFHRK